jgi:L-iditol 2-dehydrogenase
MVNRAAVLYGPGDLRVEERPMPDVGEREVLVEVRSVGICGSDVHYYEHGRIGDFVVEAPMVLGHEASGVVVGRGRSASRRQLGQRVALEPGVPCGRCSQCRSGRYNLCPDIAFFATPPVDGALARYVAIHEDFAYPLPDSVSDEAGALCEPLSVGLWACHKAGVTVGSRVTVAGAGPIGAVVTLVARSAGASEVVVSDPLEVRRQRLLAVGATAVVDTNASSLAAEAAEADVFIDCSGSAAAVADGIRSLRGAGTAVLVGMCPAAEIQFPVALMQRREVVVTGTFRYANTYPQAIALLTSGAVDLDGLVGARFPLDASEQALTAARADPSVLKPVVRVPHA